MYLGQIDRTGINRLYGEAVCGLALLQPTRAYVDSLPIKMFEYMAAGLPFVCSDFPLWSDIVEKTGAGVCVRAGDAQAASEAISRFLRERAVARGMGVRGRRAVEGEYNWGREGEKLCALYATF